MSESGFPDFLEFSSVNLTNIAGIVHCCGKIPADRKSFEIIKTLAIRRLRYRNLRDTPLLIATLLKFTCFPSAFNEFIAWNAFSRACFVLSLLFLCYCQCFL